MFFTRTSGYMGDFNEEYIMSLIKWSDKFSVNIKEIDEQHEKLSEIINNLCEINNSPKNHEEINEVFNDLSVQTRIHFKHEESLINKHDYPEYVKHIAEHNNLLQKIKSIEYLYSVNNKAIITGLTSILVDWLNEHLFEEDIKLSEYLKNKGVT